MTAYTAGGEKIKPLRNMDLITAGVVKSLYEVTTVASRIAEFRRTTGLDPEHYIHWVTFNCNVEPPPFASQAEYVSWLVTASDLAEGYRGDANYFNRSHFAMVQDKTDNVVKPVE